MVGNSGSEGLTVGTVGGNVRVGKRIGGKEYDRLLYQVPSALSYWKTYWLPSSNAPSDYG